MAAVSAERDRIASDLHDDIGASLSSIRIYSGAASKRFTSDPDESLRLIERINESSTGMMDRMSDIVWAINPKNDNVESIVFRMKSNAGEVLSPLDIEVDYSIDPLSEQVQPTMTARRNIYLIFKEAINNIAKYSSAKHVHVDLRVDNGFLILEISDDGVGFDALSKSSGNGLNTMRRRAESLGGTVQIDSKPGNGSRLIARMEIARISDGKS
jgi:signal transduction histidine kinase